MTPYRPLTAAGMVASPTAYTAPSGVSYWRSFEREGTSA